MDDSQAPAPKPKKNKIELAKFFRRDGQYGEYFTGQLGAVDVHLYWNNSPRGDDDYELVLFVVEQPKETRQPFRQANRSNYRGRR